MAVDVPRGPGVPPLLDRVTAATNTVARAVGAIGALARLLAGPQWGIYGPSFALVGDAVINLEFRKEWRVADYPMEQGAFESYNKVQTPFDARVTISKAGSVQERAIFLAALERMAGSLDLVSVVTPEIIYPSANVVHYGYTRSDKHGAAQIIADIWVREIRIAPGAQFTQTKSPNGAAPASGGTVQANEPVSSAAAIFGP